eukprot:scaffold294423_cov21-Tisochrysis_lutea.AAC.1
MGRIADKWLLLQMFAAKLSAVTSNKNCFFTALDACQITSWETLKFQFGAESGARLSVNGRRPFVLCTAIAEGGRSGTPHTALIAARCNMRLCVGRWACLEFVQRVGEEGSLFQCQLVCLDAHPVQQQEGIQLRNLLSAITRIADVSKSCKDLLSKNPCTASFLFYSTTSLSHTVMTEPASNGIPAKRIYAFRQGESAGGKHLKELLGR